MARRKLPRFWAAKDLMGKWWVTGLDRFGFNIDAVYGCKSRAAARELARDLNAVLDKHEEQRDAERG